MSGGLWSKPTTGWCRSCPSDPHPRPGLEIQSWGYLQIWNLTPSLLVLTHISASTVSACLKTGLFPYQHSPLTALTVWSSHHFQTHPYGYCYIVGFPVFQYMTSPWYQVFAEWFFMFGLSSIHRYFEKSHEDSHDGIAILSILGGAVRKKVSCIPMSGSGLYPNKIGALNPIAAIATFKQDEAHEPECSHVC